MKGEREWMESTDDDDKPNIKISKISTEKHKTIRCAEAVKQ